MLKNKAGVRYTHQHGDPATWYRNTRTGFTKHVSKLRTKARKNGWWDDIPADYYRKYF